MANTINDYGKLIIELKPRAIMNLVTIGLDVVVALVNKDS